MLVRNPVARSNAASEGFDEPVNDGLQTQSLGLRDIAGLLKRRRRFITGFIAVSTILAATAIFSRAQIYTGTAVMVLERNETRLFEAVGELQQEERDRSAIETEMDIITSRAFAARVVDAADLVNDPYYNTYLAPERGTVEMVLDGMRSLVGIVSSWADVTFDGPTSFSATSLPPIEVQRDRAVTRLLSDLDVSRSGESLAVTVRISSPDPLLAAKLANLVANVYVDWSRDLKRETTADAIVFLRQQATSVAERVAATERRITEYSRANRLAHDPRDDLLRQRLEQTNSLLTAARGELVAASARFDEGRAILDGAAETSGGTLTSPSLEQLRSNLATAEQRLAEIAGNRGPNHPERVRRKAEVESLRAMIRTETAQLVDDLARQRTMVETRIAGLEQDLGRLEENLRGRSLSEIRLRELERDLRADQKLHDELVERIGSLDPYEELVKPSARIVSAAEVPTGPSGPRLPLLLAGAIGGSTVLAMILALMLEGVDNRIRSPAQVVRLTGVPTLAVMPALRGAFLRRAPKPFAYLHRRPRSRYAEASRSLYLACRSRLGGARGVVLVTAPLPDDGATSVALALANAAAGDGMRVLLIDLDLRRSSLAGAVGLDPEEPAIGDAICGLVPLQAVARPVPDAPGLAVAYAVPGGNGPALVLNSLALGRLAEEARAHYDFVVVDTPPVLVVEDANWMVPYVDAVLVVARQARTREPDLADAVVRLRTHDAPIVGAVLNCADDATSTAPVGNRSSGHDRAARGYLTN